MRRKAKIDANQPDIVKALKDLGCSVQTLAQMGHGVPDLLVGWQGRNYLFEVKDGSRKPSERQLTIDEKAWHYPWRGQVCVIETIEDAIRTLQLCL